MATTFANTIQDAGLRWETMGPNFLSVYTDLMVGLLVDTFQGIRSALTASGSSSGS
ncbi:hypothetical protein AB0N05_11730 [Nocardia sp. NPDC051030]|uniref:hypothetical protein n=1 Tax=Nocardia sp. NPDC051030 TaxID=3155162 RepID=UPI00341D01C7